MTSTARLFALGMVAAALTGTAGTALYHAGPADKPDDKKPAAKVAPAKPAATRTVNEPAAEKPVARLTSETDVRAMLSGPSNIADVSSLTLGTLLTELENRGMDTRIDLPALLRAGIPEDMLATLKDQKLKSFGGRGTSLGDLLADATAAITWNDTTRLTYWVSGNRVVIGPAYQTPSLPGSGTRPDFVPMIAPERVVEQVVGPPVSVAVDGMPLTEAVRRLRELTGRNIVIDARAKSQADTQVAGTFDDVRLLTVLQVLADQAGLKPVTLNNVYYLTTAENAAPLQKLADRDLHGAAAVTLPPTPIPPGFVTDGYQYFPRTADMKPASPSPFGGFGGGGTGIGGGPLPGTQPLPAGPPAEKK